MRVMQAPPPAPAAAGVAVPPNPTPARVNLRMWALLVVWLLAARPSSGQHTSLPATAGDAHLGRQGGRLDAGLASDLARAPSSDDAPPSSDAPSPPPDHPSAALPQQLVAACDVMPAVQQSVGASEQLSGQLSARLREVHAQRAGVVAAAGCLADRLDELAGAPAGQGRAGSAPAVACRVLCLRSALVTPAAAGPRGCPRPAHAGNRSTLAAATAAAASRGDFQAAAALQQQVLQQRAPLLLPRVESCVGQAPALLCRSCLDMPAQPVGTARHMQIDTPPLPVCACDPPPPCPLPRRSSLARRSCGWRATWLRPGGMQTS